MFRQKIESLVVSEGWRPGVPMLGAETIRGIFQGVQGHLLRDCHEPSQCHCEDLRGAGIRCRADESSVDRFPGLVGGWWFYVCFQP